MLNFTTTTLATTVGPVVIRPVRPLLDAALLTDWFHHPRSHFWGAADATEQSVADEYRGLTERDGAWILELRGEPVALLETYDPASSPLADITADLDLSGPAAGMHILVAPPADDAPAIPGLTRSLFAASARWLIDSIGARSIVVEPDARNHAIHRLNHLAGFRDAPGFEEHPLPDKTARIQTLRAADFHCSPLASCASLQAAGDDVELPSTDAYELANRQLTAKMLREFIHERMLTPRPIGDDEFSVGLGPHTLEFRARIHALEHYSVDAASIRVLGSDELPGLVTLLADAATELQIPQNFLHTYLSEIAATLAGQARLIHRGGPSAGDLAQMAEVVDPATYLQWLESAMTKGHPGFLANAGRDGMSEQELGRFAPEYHRSTSLIWLAARPGTCVSALTTDARLAEEHRAEMDRVLERFDASDHIPLPVHPWQFNHQVTTAFTESLADGDLIYLGTDEELFHPQQSLRTFFNLSRPDSPYVKTAVAVRNMGFVRGLSPTYMSDTPAINDWLHGFLAEDPEFTAHNVRLLREFAAVGFNGDAYHRSVADGSSQASGFTKMLSALWRESPLPMLAPGSHAMTLAAVLHEDPDGEPLVGEWISRSGVSPTQWVRSLLDVYLRPAVHALESHDLVFMLHSENVILEMTDCLPTGSFFKDLGEEVAVVRRSREVPEEIQRIQVDHGNLDDAQRALSIHTDILDGVLRHLAAILDDHGILPEDDFWAVATDCIEAYRADHPDAPNPLPLLAPEFRHSCLNRLQLRNPLAMVELGDQDSSLLYAGDIANPLSRG